MDRRRRRGRIQPLDVTNGDAAAADLGGDPVVWRDVLHDGPVPAGLDPDELAQVRAQHLAARGWTTEADALAMLRERDARLAAHPPEAEVVLWFEDDLYDWLQLGQIADRLAGRPGQVWRVRLPHDRRGVDLRALPREPFAPDPAPFAALRSGDPAWWQAFPRLARLAEELPDERGLGRTERQVVDALRDGPLDRGELFARVAAQEDPPWLGDSAVWAIADDLAPLVERRGDAYALSGLERAEVGQRWIGGLRLAPRTVVL